MVKLFWYKVFVHGKFKLLSFQMDSVLTFAFNFNRSYLLPGSGTKDVKLLATKSNVFYSGQWMFKIGWPNMGALNVEAADSFLQKEFNRPLYFIVDQCKKQPTR